MNAITNSRTLENKVIEYCLGHMTRLIGRCYKCKVDDGNRYCEKYTRF